MSNALPDAAQPAPRRRRRWPWAIGGLAVLLVLLVAGMFAFWRSDAGPRWALGQVPGLTVSGLSGRPDGGRFGAERLEWRSGDTRVTVEGLAWRDLGWRLRPYPGAWLRIELVDPRAERIRVTTSKVKSDPTPAPTDLRLPIELLVRNLQVGQVQIDDLPAARQLGADLHLGADRGAMHRVGRSGARVDGLRIDGSVEVATGSGLALHGAWKVAAPDAAAAPWSADITLAGSVARPGLAARLQAASGANATVDATLQPFAPWPLAALQAGTRDLDLSILSAGLPTTRLSGRAVIESSGRNAPVRAEIDLENAVPGPWNEARLPLRRLQATVQSRPEDLRTIEIPALTLQLADAAGNAGRVSGSGRWQGAALTLDLQLANLRPSRLDARTPRMELSGSLQLALDGLPPAQPDAATPAGPTAAAAPLTARIRTELRGSLLQPTRRAVRIAGAATLTAPADGRLQIAVERLDLAAADARASVRANVARDLQRQWHVATDGTFAQFDPAAWWPGSVPAALTRQPSRLNGLWKADLVLPDAALASPPAVLADALRGDARIEVQPSRLAGMPFDAMATLRATDGASRVDATLRLAQNRATAQLDRPARGAADRWKVAIDAPALGALAPLAALVPGADAWLPTAGAVQGRAQAQGAWPTLETTGELHVRDARAPSWQVGSADARWTATTGRIDAPLTLSVAARQLASGEQRIDSLDARLDGSLRQHRLTVDATSPVRLPAWTDAAPGDPGATDGTALHLAANGGWQPGTTAGAGAWTGRVGELRAAPRRAGATPWAVARDIALRMRLDPDRGGLVEAAAEPGTLALLGATLSWTEARYAARSGAAPAIDLVARLEPMPVVPWLTRLQPDIGWSGDLRVRADIDLHRGRTLIGSVLLERAGGDVAVRVGETLRPAGLTQLRLALAASDREWQLTEVVLGTGLGELGGAQTLRLASNETLPGPATALAGQARLRANELGSWSPLLPAGWRIGGQLQADAKFAGTLGQPVIDGLVTGSGLSLKNLFEGVDMRDGDLAATLSGTDARIERLVFHDAAKGEIRVDGRASFGSAPSARISVAADKFQALARLDRRVVASGRADVSLGGERVGVDGRFVIDEGQIDLAQSDAPKLDSDVTVVNRRVDIAAAARRPSGSSTATAMAQPPKSPFRNTDVQLTLGMGDHLRVRGRGLDALIKGELRITTPQGQLAVNGTLRTDAGIFAAYGQNLAIERGVIVLTGDVTAPRLDILAVRPDIDTRVGVTVQGSALSPRIRLYSEPERSDMDKLSWLVLGREPSQLGGADTALLQRAALALAAGQGGGSTSFIKQLGLDELSVSGVGAGDLSQAVVSVGKQISKNLFVGYERGLNAATGAWQLVYRIARQFTLRAKSGDGSAIDAVYTWRWNGRTPTGRVP
jgi:translocation and assembly module TamB